MSKNQVHEGGPGNKLPWTNTTGSAVAAGSVVKMADTIGVAAVDIPNNGVGTVEIGGVFRNMPKTAGHAWVPGQKLVWDVSANAFDTVAVSTATGDVTGAAIAWLAATSGDTVGVVKLTPGNATTS